MSGHPVTVTVAWFGKLPARGDFLRSTQQGLLTQRLDQWLSQGLDLMAVDPRWKEVYDQAGPAPFVLFNVRGRAMLVGYLQPSADVSGRRYPFVLTGSLELEGRPGLWVLAPLFLESLWRDLAQAGRQALQAEEPARQLEELAVRAWSLEIDGSGQQAALQDFLEDQNLGTLQALLRQGGHPAMDLHKAMVALGLLLQPVPASGVSSLDRGLSLPLPDDPLYSGLVASFWLTLVAPFVARADFELSLHLDRTEGAGQCLSVGFAGASPSALQAMLDRRQAETLRVSLVAPDWVEAHLEDSFAMKELSSYLRQPQLSLAQAVATFKECFLGE